MPENNAEDIKQAVLSRYSLHAQRRLAALQETAGSSCCGAPQEAPAEASCSCCGETGNLDAIADANVAGMLYSAEELRDLPEDVLTSLGCGNPTAIAGLEEGESVLDLGSGGGLDCFLAASKVGPAGKIVGLDMSADMLQLARRNAGSIGAENVRFRLGEMEDMPFDDASFDVIISNCVINLSPDKDAVFGEAHRVLKPGGRLRASDIVWAREPTEKERSDIVSWTACVAGALTEADYVAKLRAAGFDGIRVEPKEGTAPDSALFSAYVSAEKRR
jgi:SAM-dependent methyltransferase